jgi:hypothetical protein
VMRLPSVIAWPSLLLDRRVQVETVAVTALSSSA